MYLIKIQTFLRYHRFIIIVCTQLTHQLLDTYVVHYINKSQIYKYFSYRLQSSRTDIILTNNLISDVCL